MSLEIKNTNVYGLEESIIRSGYPMQVGDPDDITGYVEQMIPGLNRAYKLGKVPTGTGHDNFLKGIIVQFDVKYPQYWTPQFQRYTFADIISSQSKMHKITSMKNVKDQCNEHVFPPVAKIIDELILIYNEYNFEKDGEYQYEIDYSLYKNFQNKKEVFNAIISNLPMGYEMWMGISTNYLQLKTIYHQRRNHKLDEWHIFCDWIESLPRWLDLVNPNNTVVIGKNA